MRLEELEILVKGKKENIYVIPAVNKNIAGIDGGRLFLVVVNPAFISEDYLEDKNVVVLSGSPGIERIKYIVVSPHIDILAKNDVEKIVEKILQMDEKARVDVVGDKIRVFMANDYAYSMDEAKRLASEMSVKLIGIIEEIKSMFDIDVIDEKGGEIKARRVVSEIY